MTELAPVEPAEQTAEMSALVRWAMDAQQAHQVARSLARTSFVPASLRDRDADVTAANVTAAILTGAELGLQPMAALRSMDIIQGTPALRAHAMRGLVQSQGHQVELVESTPEKCVMRGRRRAPGVLVGGFGEWQEVTWTIQRARELGLAAKEQWKKQPQTMLVARATGELCRLIAADVLFAVPYASEELDGDSHSQPVQVASSRPVTAAEIRGEAPLQSPQPEPTPESAEVPAGDSGEFSLLDRQYADEIDGTA